MDDSAEDPRDSETSYAAEKRRLARRHLQRRFLESRGIPARPSEGNPDRWRLPRRRKTYEQNRAEYLRLKVRALGVTMADAEAMTPRKGPRTRRSARTRR